MSEQVLEVPSVLIGTVEQLCEEVLARREQYGISSVTVFEKHMEAFGSGGGKTCWGVFHLTVPFPSVWLWHHTSADKLAHRAELKHVVQDLHA